jgi:DNA-directed RNA polymerase specialized sigma24 family protein
MQSFFRPSPTGQDEQEFALFYATYTPKLWGLMRLANLPTARSEAILVNVLVKAWQHPDRQLFISKQPVSWLLSLAYAEGLPASTLTSVFKAS